MQVFNIAGETYSDSDGTALSTLLGGQRVRLTQVGTPVTSSDRQNAELGNDDGGTDGSSNFLGGLDSETDVTLAVTDDNDGLEAGTLTGTGLLLDRLDLLFGFPSALPNSFLSMRFLDLISNHPNSFASFAYFLPSFRQILILILRGKHVRTFMTSSFSLGRKKSTIWYSLTGRECR